jgi:TniQ
MTAGPRALPIRIAPVPGEALDSWHEALAARLQATPGDLTAAVFPAARPGAARTASVITVSDDDAAAIAAACGLTAAGVHGLTLARFDGVALRLGPRSGHVARNVLWGRASGSRFCPQCLAETGGRWQLAWRLSWSFACLTHSRLLADACPECGRMQRLKPHPVTQVPRPGTCASPGPGATGVSSPRCGADLTAARTLALDPGHPVLAAQQFISRIIATGHAGAGIYASSPQPADAALADVRALAATILRASSPGSLASVLPADITAEYDAAVSVPHERHGSRPTTASILPGSLAPASAAVTAAAVTAAVVPLAFPCPGKAASALRRVFRAEETQSWDRASRAASPALQAVRLTALGRAAEAPAPGEPPAAARARARQVPALFWPAWTARLLPPLTGTTPQERRRFLPAAFLAVTAGTSMASATQVLGGVIASPSATRILQRAERDPRWPASVTALARLAGWLDQNGAPVDYQRRRGLDYGNLLPDSDWARICRRTGTVAGERDRAGTARRWLFERISGTPAELAPGSYAAIAAFQRHRLDKFAVFATPDLTAALDDYAAAWLARQRIDGEEVTWRPPAFLLSGLDLPGPDPLTLAPGEIHELLRIRRMSPRAAACHAGTTIDVIRAVLDEHPAPPPPAPAQERARGQAIGKLRARLSPGELNDLYANQRLSLEEIGRRHGVSRDTVASLAREYGIRMRTPAENHPPIPVDRDWLYEQYMTRNRPLADTAAELGMSVTNLTRRRRTLGIPSRRQQAPFPVDRDWLYEQYWSRNRPLADIAAELGVTIRTVNRWVKTLGIPLRGRADRRHHSLSPPN